jgi:hypothetical protein
MIQKLISLSFIPQNMVLEDTHASFLLRVVYTLWHRYSKNLTTPQNLHDDVIHLLHNDVKKFTNRWSVMWQSHTQHHLIHSGMWIWVSSIGWTGACQIQSAAHTLFEPLAPVKHCCTLPTAVNIHVSFTNVLPFHTQELDDVALCMPRWIHDCPPLSNKLLCRDYTVQHAYDVRWHKND